MECTLATSTSLSKRSFKFPPPEILRNVVSMILDTEWRTSKKSNNNGACVEVRATANGGVQVRDSKDAGNGPVHSFTGPEWDAFLDGAKNGEFEIA